MDSYFSLSEQFTTQSEPEYCGPGTLVVLLNTLKIDPKKQWKGIWRWYSEENLHCTNGELLKLGLCLEEFSTLAKCNGLFVQAFRPKENLENGEDKGIIKSQLEFFKKTNKPILDPFQSKVITHEHDKNPYCCGGNNVKVKEATYNTFRIACIACSRRNTMLLAVNSMRKFLGQTGTGHFSPVCGYHPSTSNTLLLDIARYKYPAYWLNSKDLYNSLIPFDLDTRKKRGFTILSRRSKGSALCRGIHDLVNMKQMKQYFKHLIKDEGKDEEGITQKIIQKNKTANKEMLDEVSVLFLTYAHDIEKRIEAGMNIKRIGTELGSLGPLYKAVKKLFNEKEIMSDPLVTILDEMCPEAAAEIFTIFILSFPREVIDKLLIDAKAWDVYKLGKIREKARIVYKEIVLMREMMGILGEKLNGHGYYCSEYLRTHSCAIQRFLLLLFVNVV
eukprot:TRINITY_DN1492_c0_g1_i2.p1 TRINITY_DN1492_c0_g1~~TRINITY_DN1492_c0_g1_i2.p1  ORF type:complete len:445 (+),score=33.19 TRINITY_DN1492_c0_g1_i2:248-1582(+)